MFIRFHPDLKTAHRTERDVSFETLGLDEWLRSLSSNSACSPGNGLTVTSRRNNAIRY